jgi:hypothetical protein
VPPGLAGETVPFGSLLQDVAAVGGHGGHQGRAVHRGLLWSLLLGYEGSMRL